MEMMPQHPQQQYHQRGEVETGKGSELPPKRSATIWTFSWRVLCLLGRQVTFLCSLNLLRLPFVCCYYFYVWLPLFFLALFLKYALIILQVSSRRSTSFKRLIRHYIAFHQTIINIIRKIRRSSLSELTEWILTTIYEVVFTIFDESAEDSSLYDVSNPLHFAELIGYMELEEPHNPQQRRREKRMRHLMHHHVPSRPFRASVRLHPQGSHSSHSSTSTPGQQGSSKASSTSRQQSLTDITTRWLRGKRQNWIRGVRGDKDNNRRQTDTDVDYIGGVMSSGADRLMSSFGFRSRRSGGMSVGGGTCSASGYSELWSEVESVSRTSVPRTPETFARVMDSSRDRVDSVVFFVRDKLRLEEQRQSHDENSRSMASRLLRKGKFGVFDPYHTNKAIELSAGLHCAGVRKMRPSQGQVAQGGPSMATPTPSPTKRTRNNGSPDCGCELGDRKAPGACSSSHSSLDSLDSCKAASPPHSFFSTRAAIPLMQDAFVYFEYFIKSTSPGSLTTSCAGDKADVSRPPVVSLGLASCDFSLDSMVGDDDRSLGLGLFPEDCLHPCRLYLSKCGSSASSVQNHMRRAAEREEEDEGDQSRAVKQSPCQAGGQSNEQRGDNRCSFEMLGGPQPSSGDRIGVLVYICGAGEGAAGEKRWLGSRSRSSFGKDPSTDCLFAEGGVTARSGHQNIDDNCDSNGYGKNQKHGAGCTPRQPPRDLLTTPEDEYEYDFTHDDGDDDEEEEDEEDEGCAEARLAALLGQGLLDDEDDEGEDGMHVCFNLNGCPLHVPWPAVGQISEMPWGQTALYPTISFAVPPPVPACSPSPSPSPPQLQTSSSSSSSSNSNNSGAESSNLPAERPENTVKIWGGFCVDDIQYKTREAIGAPPGVCVYCLDGSMLLTEQDDGEE